jgi:hypothetical protein
VRFLQQVAGVQNRDLPLAYTARSGVKSQQDDAGICADLVLVRVSKAAQPRGQDADVQAPPHFRPVRGRHALQAIWAGMGKRGCALGEFRFTTALGVIAHSTR